MGQYMNSNRYMPLARLAVRMRGVCKGCLCLAALAAGPATAAATAVPRAQASHLQYPANVQSRLIKVILPFNSLAGGMQMPGVRYYCTATHSGAAQTLCVRHVPR
jgi:hypothetical protein